MASVGVSAIKLIDSDGDPLDDGSGRLNVNAYLNATPTIDIGDVSLLLGGTAASTNAGTMDAQTLRVTLATDDTHWGTVGTAADADGTAHGQLRAIVNSLSSQTAMSTNLASIKDYTYSLLETTGAAFDSSDTGAPSLVVRNDTLANLDGTIADGDYSMLQVNAIGALYVTGESKQQTAVVDYGFSIMGEAKVIDGSALPNSVSEGNAGRLAMSRACVAYTCLTDEAGASDLGAAMAVDLAAMEALLITIDSDTDAIKTAVEILDNAISGSEMQVDVVAALPAGPNTIGVVDLGTTDNAVLDAIAASLVTIDSDTNAVQGYLNAALYADDANWTDDSSSHFLVGGLYQSSMQSVTDGDVAPFQVDANGVIKVSPSTGSEFQVDVVSGSVGHDITGMVSGSNPDVGTSAEILRALGNVACKRVDIIASSANTGVIWVGGSNLAANSGIPLSPGDFYSVDVNGTSDIYLLAAVNGEDVYYNYYT